MTTPLRVLIVEDREDDALLMAGELRRAGFDPEWVRVRSEAEYRANLGPSLDLILAGHSLPQFDGLSALGLLRRSDLDVPFLIVSETSDEDVAVNALRAGAHNYVTKSNLGRLGPAAHWALRDAQERRARRELEAALRESEARLRAVVQNAVSGILTLSAGGVIESFNPAAGRILGYGSDEVVGKNFMVLLAAPPHDEYDDGPSAFSRAGIREAVGTCREVRGRHKSGRVIPLDLSVSEMRLGDRQQLLMIFRDITDSKQVEQERAERVRLAELMTEVNLSLTHACSIRAMLQRCAEALVSHLGGALARVWTLNEADDVLELQASAGLSTRLDGYHARVAVGRSKIGRIAAKREPHVANVAAADPGAGGPYGARRKGPVSFVAHPLVVDDRLVGLMALFARHPLSAAAIKTLASVADGVAVGVERWRAEEALRAAHIENDRLLESIPSILIGLDRADRVTRWNQAAEQTFGLPAGDVTGRPLGAADIRWADDKLAEALETCRRERRVVRLDDVAFLRADGTRGCLGLTLTPLSDRQDGLPGILLLGADVTERRQLEAQLVQAQKLESIGQLAAGVAHEINTPIQYIGDNTTFLRDAFADLCKVLPTHERLLEACRANAVTPEMIDEAERQSAQADVEYLSEEIPRAVRQTLEGVETVARIVRALKEFSHPGSQEKTAVDINRAIENTLTVARNEWKYSADVVTDFDPSLPSVPCLPGAFNQVMLNLIVNAAHAIADRVAAGGLERGTITVGTRRLEGHAEIRVGDTGCGIPEAVRARVFDPFFTTKPLGKGTGQGLAIAHGVVVKKHGGQIAFETEVGKGTTFRVLLPIAGSVAEGGGT